jgi:hypothetical protein
LTFLFHYSFKNSATMKNNLMPAIRLTLVCMAFFCGVYTFAVWAVAQLAPGQGKGLTVTENGKTYHILSGRRSALINTSGLDPLRWIITPLVPAGATKALPIQPI